MGEPGGITLRGREFHDFLIYLIIHDNVYYAKNNAAQGRGEGACSGSRIGTQV